MPTPSRKTDRAVFRIVIAEDAAQALDEITRRTGMTQIAVTSRLVDWFADQPNLIQAAVLGLYPTVVPKDVVTLILERMQRGEG
jgi:hypothetical protein